VIASASWAQVSIWAGVQDHAFRRVLILPWLHQGKQAVIRIFSRESGCRKVDGMWRISRGLACDGELQGRLRSSSLPVHFGGRTSSRCSSYTTTNEYVAGAWTPLNTIHIPLDRLSLNSATRPSHLRRCFAHQQPARSSSAALSSYPQSALALPSRSLRDHARRSHVARKLSRSLLRSSNSALHRQTPRRRP
jgi:hypothetical protein